MIKITPPVLFRQYRTLDALLIIYCLSIVAFVSWALVFKTIPQSQLPILAGFVGSVFGVITGYAASRFGTPSQAGNVHSDPGATSMTVTTTPDAAPALTPPTGGSSVVPAPGQAVTVTHVFGEPPPAA